MPASTLAIAAIYLGFALLELWRSNLFAKPEQTRDDAIVEAVSMVMLIAVTQPAVLFAAGALAQAVAPEYAGALAGLNLVAAVALFLVLDDMVQYWWHRASHSTPWLYNLHRAHHNARYMSMRLGWSCEIIRLSCFTAAARAAAVAVCKGSGDRDPEHPRFASAFFMARHMRGF